jgi:hypothetical protein
MNNIKFPLVLLILLAPEILRSQIVEITYGEIPQEDVTMTSYAPDPGADAVILDDFGVTYLTNYDGIHAVTERHKRIKIINSDGFDYADIIIYYWNTEKFTNIQATTYNFENGEITATKLEKKGIYYEKSGKVRNSIRFTMPNVRVGSVLEIKYTFTSENYFSLYSWEFQHDIPVRYGGYKIMIPSYFQYKIIPSGNFDKIKYKKDDGRVHFGNSYCDGFIAQWNYSGIPAYRAEPYSTGSNDYLTRVGFELAKINIPGYYFEEISPTYFNLSKKLLNRDDFGRTLNNSFLVRKNALAITVGAKNETEKLRMIYKYITENFVWNSENDFTASTPLLKTVKKERGNSADINLLLIDMLKEAGLSVKPVILSTRENGELNPLYAIMQRFNYVVASVIADGNLYIVDATDPLRPFNMLPFECLNGQGWSIAEQGAKWVSLSNGEIDKENVFLNLQLSDSAIFRGNAQNSFTGYNAYGIRHAIKLLGKEGYIEATEFEKGNWSFENYKWENLDSLELPVKESFNLTISDVVEQYGSKLAFRPVLTGTSARNPFYSEERLCPVDFGCPQESSYVVRILLPSGFSVEELPSSVKLSLPDNGGQYVFNVSCDNTSIMVQTKLTINSIRFAPENYNLLREFYARIMEKEEELIILTPTI